MKKSKYLNVAGFVCTALISVKSMAQTAPVPDHPRENEVNQRLDNQQARINQGLANGTMTGKQAAATSGTTRTLPSAKRSTSPSTTDTSPRPSREI